MGQPTEQLKDVKLQTATAIGIDTKNLVRYGIQIAMLNSLLSHGLITEKECHQAAFIRRIHRVLVLHAPGEFDEYTTAEYFRRPSILLDGWLGD